MPHTILGNRSLIHFSGPDAEHLLHNVVTCNVEILSEGNAQIGALLTPQGKIMFEFLISRTAEDAFTIDIDTHSASAFAQRMTMYKMRSKVEISQPVEALVQVSWEEDSTGPSDLKDTRFVDGSVTRSHIQAGETTDQFDWDAYRIAKGVVESGSDYALGDVFPHDVSMDQNGGVDFSKGCYIGQEVVSRMHHRHTARRRVLIATSEKEFGEEIDVSSNGKALGQIGTIAANKALALCRIDRVHDSIQAGNAITVGDQVIALELPPSVTYSWPAEAEDG